MACGFREDQNNVRRIDNGAETVRAALPAFSCRPVRRRCTRLRRSRRGGPHRCPASAAAAPAHMSAPAHGAQRQGPHHLGVMQSKQRIEDVPLPHNLQAYSAQSGRRIKVSKSVSCGHALVHRGERRIWLPICYDNRLQSAASSGSGSGSPVPAADPLHSGQILGGVSSCCA